ncbi:putative ABC transport system ATP-binding protein [Dysgonomonas sp. PH5-45]|uniref:ATP-binding cassette domain-containing protein n=1 Tax=unclassified Dysgonomonas TaxID=2630389 RepID=UPI00247670DB|nr:MULTISPECIES: ATP-binding cassette domain-containing protein [unclassified Dysgonomonas]MDH6354149.1 putative ABC transport system ATP-binding protein [Dysgonomonas sp. PH5-45]MDH6387000.1 putative ABC transport system ATP-binding protein [Dysgonomonas sp. PH5-37]
MNQIKLYDVLPDVFRGEVIESEVWQHTIQFEAGERYLIESASGKGKSSLCSFMYGYRHDYSGTISLNGHNIKTLPPKQWDDVRRTQLSLLFQELRLFPELTVLENIQIKNNLTGYKTPAQIKSLLEELNIDEKINEKIGKMSWGQQQRVAVVRSLCQPFRFLVLDEPISHLDDDNSLLIAQMVTAEAQTQGAAIIVTSIGKHLPIDYHQKFAL